MPIEIDNSVEMAGCAGSGSGTTCVPFADTVPVPYGTIAPRVGSNVIKVMLVPTRVFNVFGYVIATGRLVLAFAGWKATIKTETIVGTGGL